MRRSCISQSATRLEPASASPLQAGEMVVEDASPERIALAMLAAEGTGPAWGIEIEAAREGYARIRMRLRPDMLNGHGIAHGGMIFALADTAFAYACNSRNVRTVAAQASIAFLSPAESGEWLIAEAEEQALVGRSGVYGVIVRGEDGRILATFQGLSRTLGGPVITGNEVAGD
jgi:acyl-CoA thioesterase